MLWRSHGYLHITPPFSRGLLETLKSCQPAPNLPSGKHEKKYTPEKPTWNPTKLVVCRCFSIDVSPFSREVSSGFMLVFKGCKIHFNQSSSPIDYCFVVIRINDFSKKRDQWRKRRLLQQHPRFIGLEGLSCDELKSTKSLRSKSPYERKTQAVMHHGSTCGTHG